jgi:hypothetical protein
MKVRSTLRLVKDVTFSTDGLARSELLLRIGFASDSRFPDETNELCPVHDAGSGNGIIRVSLPVASIVRCQELPRSMVRSVS